MAGKVTPRRWRGGIASQQAHPGVGERVCPSLDHGVVLSSLSLSEQASERTGALNVKVGFVGRGDLELPGSISQTRGGEEGAVG